MRRPHATPSVSAFAQALALASLALVATACRQAPPESEPDGAFRASVGALEKGDTQGALDRLSAATRERMHERLKAGRGDAAPSLAEAFFARPPHGVKEVRVIGGPAGGAQSGVSLEVVDALD